MNINIYRLVNPSTNQVIYVGQTTKQLSVRLDNHYWKLNEANRGGRTKTKLFTFLDLYLPLRVRIELIKVVDTNKPFANADFVETYYINKYRLENPNLLNEADGGIGGYTSINKSNDEKSIIGIKISKANKGKPKPIGFGENLSIQRTGRGNPAAKKLTIKIGAYLNSELIKSFEYGFEINEFVDNKSAYSNVRKVLTGRLKYKPYGYVWKYIE